MTKWYAHCCTSPSQGKRKFRLIKAPGSGRGAAHHGLVEMDGASRPEEPGVGGEG